MKKTSILLLVLIGLMIFSCGGFLVYRGNSDSASSSVEFIEKHFSEEIDFASRCAFDNNIYIKRNHKEIQKLYSQKGILESKFSLQPNSFTIISGDYSYRQRSVFLPKTPSPTRAVSNKCYDRLEDGTEMTVIEYYKLIKDNSGQQAQISLIFDLESLEKLKAEIDSANTTDQSENKPAR